MKNTLKELLSEDKNLSLEVFKPAYSNDDYKSWEFHGDFIIAVDKELDEIEDDEIIRYAVLDKDDIQQTLFANCAINFDDIYNEDEKVLAVLIKR